MRTTWLGAAEGSQLRKYYFELRFLRCGGLAGRGSLCLARPFRADPLAFFLRVLLCIEIIFVNFLSKYFRYLTKESGEE